MRPRPRAPSPGFAPVTLLKRDPRHARTAATAANIKRFRTQLQSLGFSYDWDREVDTTDPGYYRWTQWIFLKLYDTWFDEEQQRGGQLANLMEEFQGGIRDWSWSLSTRRKMPGVRNGTS